MGVFSTARELHIKNIGKTADFLQEDKKNNDLEQEKEEKTTSKNNKSVESAETPKRKTARKSTK